MKQQDVDLSRAVRRSVNSGKKMQAVVREHLFDRVTIQLVGNGQVLRNLPLVGGPVAENDIVFVDMSTVPFTVYAKGNEYLSASDLQDALERVGALSGSGDAKISVCLFSGGAVIGMYSPSVDGLGTALSAAQAGDLVWVADIEVEGDFTIPDGVALCGISSRQSIIYGTVTMGKDSSIENLAVIKASWSADEQNAIIAQGTGTASWVRNCEIHAYNCGAGIARAVKIAADTDRIQFSNCVIVADANESLTASAFDGAGGTCYVNDCQVYSKSADHFNGTTFYIHNNITHVSEINRRCIPIVSEDHLLHRYQPWADPHGSLPRLVPGTPTVYQFVDEPLGTWNEGNHGKFEEFVYQDYTNGSGNRVIREVRTTDGNTIDVTVWSGAPLTYADRFVVVTKRELNVFNSDNTKGRVYKVNFETETSTKIFEFDIVADEGDEITGVGYKYYRDLNFTYLKGDDGNLYLAIVGTWYKFEREDVTYGDVYTAGPVFWLKNWTLNQGWQKFEGPQFYDDTIAFDQFSSGLFISVVNSRYICVTANFQWDNIAGDIASIGAWSFDIIDSEIKQHHIVQVPQYGSFSPSPGQVCNSETNNVMYILYSGSDYQVSNDGYDVVYTWNPVTGSLTEYDRASGTEQYIALLVNKSIVYLWVYDNPDNNFMNLDTQTMLLSNPGTLPTWHTYSKRINDSGEIVAYDKTAGLIRLYSIPNDSTTSIDVNLEVDTAAQTVNIFPLNGSYVITGNRYVGPGSNFEFMCWVIV